MTTGLTYSQYVTELANLAVVSATDTNFLTNLPSCIDYAELRIYQDLDLLSTVSAQTGFSLTANNRALSFPDQQTFVTIQEINVITPSGTTDPNQGTRNPCLPISKEYLDFVWGSSTDASLPTLFAMRDQQTVLFGPWPDQGYSLEIVGTIRPPSLSSGNPETFISLNLPQLLLMASMVFISAYQRNWGKMSDDPQMAVSYEAQYQTTLASALKEEVRKKFSGTAWTSMSPSPTASPARS